MATERVFADAKQWAAFQRRLGKAFTPAALKGIRAGGLRCIPLLHRSTETAPPASTGGGTGAVDTGDYKRRWRTSPLPNGVEVFNDAPEAGVIELGRRPGSRPPPSSVLQPWVRRKLGLSDAQAKGVAFVVARAIGRRGLRARRVMARALPAMRKAVMAEVKLALQKVIRRTP